MSEAEQQALLTLQDLDTDLDRHRHRRATLPERGALAAIDADAARVGDEIERVVGERDEVAGRQAALERELAATEDRADAVNRRLYGGEVSASRELQAMAADVDALKARVSALEDQILEILEQREPLDGQVAALGTQIAGLRERRVTAAAAVLSAEATVDAEIEALVARRAEAASALPADVLATYERLRARLDGVAVARLVGSRCDGCHLTLPATELDRIRHLPAGELVSCDQCGRILVRI